ncbi:hypothetical protein HOY82DRAFT_138724 [Tuber indicum]|nr:hypothetical protein HOY82DRAFT_138724 [Tuber indicum]
MNWWEWRVLSRLVFLFFFLSHPGPFGVIIAESTIKSSMIIMIGNRLRTVFSPIFIFFLLLLCRIRCATVA